MLQVEHISKKYVTGKLVQNALDDVSLNLRDNEFVAILGPSGSGKTTLLNMIGGLDRYDSGDLIINGISTKKYTDRDWDSYRNHTIGFIFQSYNLIPHQTVLQNVELALTISGVGRSERRRRATEALEEVGLGDQINKKPNQLSGGQMQRVAIARALVNDPDIVLADEPTGALDSDTSVQIMDLLKEVASDRLVVMVTHNPDLAEEYATRIVNLKDGRICGDSDPYEPDETEIAEPVHQNMGKSSMSVGTAIGLSLNNLWSKKARTILTAFAGSIGIIGIALILSLSTGVNQYIEQIEEDTLSESPVQITSNGFDITSMMAAAEVNVGTMTGQTGTENDINVVQLISNMLSSVTSNDLESLKQYIETDGSELEDYTNSIEYQYGISPQVFRVTDDDTGYRQINPDSTFTSIGFGSITTSNSMMSSFMDMGVFYQLPQDTNLYQDQYEVMAGRWPEDYNELVVVLTENGGMTDFMGYALGLRDPEELDDMIQRFLEGEEGGDAPEFDSYAFEDILGMQFKLVNAYEYYTYDSDTGVWVDKSDNKSYMKDLVDNGEDLTIVGIVEPKEDATGISLTMGINYSSTLIDHIVDEAAGSEIVADQLANRSTNVFTGEPFGEDSDEGLDLGDMFEIDEDALADLFDFGDMDMSSMMDGMDMSSMMGGMDLSSLGGTMDMSGAFDFNGSTFDMSGMLDLGDIALNISNMLELTLGDLTDSLSIGIDQEQMGELMNQLIAGYSSYADTNNGVFVTNVIDGFESYVNENASSLISADLIREYIDVDVDVTSDQVTSLITEITNDFRGSGYSDLTDYLEKGGGVDIIINWIEQNGISININTEKISESIVDTLTNGFLGNGSSDVTMSNAIVQSFMSYLQTDSATELLSAALAPMLDTSSIEQQITVAMQSYMADMMSAMTEQMGAAMEESMSGVMEEMMSEMMNGMDMSSITSQMTDQLSSAMNSSLSDMMGDLAFDMSDMLDFDIDADAFADAFSVDFDTDDMTELLMSISGSGSATYDSNLADMGYADFDSPTEIDIYPKDFEAKEYVTTFLDDYNEKMDSEGEEDKVITYTDMVGTLMSSVTDIINLISYVLIAFVAISLVVSSIMIGVITYISVLERQKEIGILRAMGASKGNISTVFNAEAAIIGLAAGLLGILISNLLLIPGNAFIHMMAGNTDVNAVLEIAPAVGLVLLSVVLTFIGGLIPSSQAARSDPVKALRTE